jgi:hypothetical protein
MIHVPNRPHIHVRLGPLKFALGHFLSSKNASAVDDLLLETGGDYFALALITASATLRGASA